jgi:DNA-binding Lrp family transcriptional regulator
LEKLKSIDQKILSGLMKNSKISDRQLAKEIGVSQPTVTRRRARLEKKAIDGYTLVPKWTEMGFEILAITMVKSYPSAGLRGNVEANIGKAVKWMKGQPSVILASGCRGMNRSGVMISVHKSYADFDRFMSEHKRELGDLFSEIDTAIVNLGGGEVIKPLHLKYLAEAK